MQFDQSKRDLEETVERLTRQLRQRTDELSESLEQQTAASEVLKVISSSPGELEPVFQAMLENATRICEAKFGVLLLCDSGGFRTVALHNAPPAFAEDRRRNPLIHPPAGTGLRRLAETKQVAQVADMKALKPYIDGDAFVVNSVDLGGYRTVLNVPMLKEGTLIGAISIYRQEVRPFTDKQIALVSSFANQAVIAIENTRLLNELRERTDDLSVALEHQTATGEILSSISGSVTDAKPVFEAIVRNLRRLFGTRFAMVQLLHDGIVHLAAAADEAEFETLTRQFPRPLDDTSGSGLAMLSKQVVQFAPALADPATPPTTRGFARALGFDSVIYAPMMREGKVIGAVGTARPASERFDDRQVALIKTFADQAVIAIENVRLFDEVQARTDDLTEALEQQTATSEVLQVISSSPGELEPVFEAMLAKATNICEAKFGVLWQREGRGYRAVAMYGVPSAYSSEREREPVIYPEPEIPLGRLTRTKKVLQISDIRNDESYIKGFPPIVNLADNGGARTLLMVPMLKEGELIGAIAIYRQEVRPFTDKQIELVRNFAAQAVIAIENTRLLNELRQRTDDLSEALEQQTATSEVLKVISSSPGALEPVFESMLANATRLCGAKFGTLGLYDGKMFRNVALYNVPAAYADVGLREPFRPHLESGLAQLAATKRVIQTDDLRKQPPYLDGDPAVVAIADLAGARTILNVPMLKEDKLVGAISIFRQDVRPFTEKQIELVSNFAAQAVIAIENTRLLNELRQRTDDLTESLEQQTATSEVLRVISTSPGDLQPVFEAMLANATRVCGAKFGTLYRFDNGAFQPAAMLNAPSAYSDFVWQRGRFLPEAGNALDRLLQTKELIPVIDDAAEQSPTPSGKLGGARSYIAVPILKERELVGAFIIYRQEVRPFTDKQIALVTNFAAQAVIAIENTRLLNELRESLQQQTATADVLKVISRSNFGEIGPIERRDDIVCDRRFVTQVLLG